MYKEYNIGPNTEPCGAPRLRCDECDGVPTTNCVRSDRYEKKKTNQKVLLQISMRVDNLLRKIKWSTVSNVADQSRRTRITEYSLSMAVTISL